MTIDIDRRRGRATTCLSQLIPHPSVMVFFVLAQPQIGHHNTPTTGSISPLRYTPKDATPFLCWCITRPPLRQGPVAPWIPLTGCTLHIWKAEGLSPKQSERGPCRASPWECFERGWCRGGPGAIIMGIVATSLKQSIPAKQNNIGDTDPQPLPTLFLPRRPGLTACEWSLKSTKPQKA